MKLVLMSVTLLGMQLGLKLDDQLVCESDLESAVVMVLQFCHTLQKCYYACLWHHPLYELLSLHYSFYHKN